MKREKMKITFCPATSVLTAESNQTLKFEEKVKFGKWNDILDKNNEVLLYVQVVNEGSGSYAFNTNGLDESDQPEDYDIHDILNYQDIHIVDESGKTTGSLTVI